MAQLPPCLWAQAFLLCSNQSVFFESCTNYCICSVWCFRKGVLQSRTRWQPGLLCGGRVSPKLCCKWHCSWKVFNTGSCCCKRWWQRSHGFQQHGLPGAAGAVALSELGTAGGVRASSVASPTLTPQELGPCVWCSLASGGFPPVGRGGTH